MLRRGIRLFFLYIRLEDKFHISFERNQMILYGEVLFILGMNNDVKSLGHFGDII